MDASSLSPASVAATGLPLRSILKKQAFPVQSTAEKHVLFNESSCAAPTGEWAIPSAENAYRYALDRE